MNPIFANVIQDAFSPLISVFKAIMVFLHGNVTGGSWGLAIIGLTIVVRAALVPLTVKQFSSMAKLQALGPEIKKLQAEHKEDKQRLNEEMMKFYRENQVNPLSSCLPLVLQFPVFISLFYMLRSDLKLQICGAALKAHHIVSSSAIQHADCQSVKPGSGKFLFIPDVTASAHGAVLIVLIVLYIGSQLISSLLTTATVDRNQRLIALGLPFLFTAFIISFPAGLILYWITTNLWTVGQQFTVRRFFPPALAPAAGPAKKSPLWPRKSPAPTASSGAANGRAPSKAAAERAATDVKGGAERKTPAGGKTPAPEKTPAGGKAPGGAKTPAGGKTPTGGRSKGAAAVVSPKAAKSPEGEDAGGGKATTTPRPRGTPPPPPPRKKKKRSGRRR